MVWSETIGNFIVIPGDAVAGDGRNRIVIGEQIPADLASVMSAGQIFYNGTPDPTFSDILYWVLGIDVNGNFVVLARWRQWVGTDGSGNPIWSEHNETMLTMYQGLGNDDPPYMNIPYRLNQRLGVFTDTEINRVVSDKIISISGTKTAAVTSFRAGWAAFTTGGYMPLRFSRSPDGTILVNGFTQFNGGVGSGTDVCNVSGIYAPLYGHAPIPANVQDTFRFAEVRTDGSLRLRGAVPTVGNFVSFEGIYQGQEF